MAKVLIFEVAVEYSEHVGYVCAFSNLRFGICGLGAEYRA